MEPGLLAEEARKIAEGRDMPPAFPFDPDDVVFLGALASVAGKREEEAARLLEVWHGRSSGSTRTRRLHSQLLARRAVKTLRNKEVQQTHDLLVAALELIQGEGA